MARAKKKAAKKTKRAAPKPRRRPNGEEKGRINMKIDAELKSWAVGYAGRQGTSVTQIFIDHLVDLRRREAEDLQRDAEQI